MIKRLLVSALSGFAVAVAASEVIVQLARLLSRQTDRSGLDVLAEAAAYTTMRIFIVIAVAPASAFFVFRRLRKGRK